MAVCPTTPCQILMKNSTIRRIFFSSKWRLIFHRCKFYVILEWSRNKIEKYLINRMWITCKTEYILREKKIFYLHFFYFVLNISNLTNEDMINQCQDDSWSILAGTDIYQYWKYAIPLEFLTVFWSNPTKKVVFCVLLYQNINVSMRKTIQNCVVSMDKHKK